MVKQKRGKTVAQATAEIRDFYEIGRGSLEEFSDRFPLGNAEKAAAKARMNSDRLRKARMFAREFSKPELIRLCREIDYGGFPIGVQHVVRLMWLPANRRWKFLRQTIEEKLSCRQLATVIQQATGRRPRTGRMPRVKDRAEAIQKLLRLCEEWRRLNKAILGTNKSHENGDGSIVESLPPSLDGPMRRCDLAIQRLYRMLGRFRKV
ncbi:MAG: hypothetical protein ABSB74_03825 [Tepidisphaeraceae bacterium]